MKFQLISSSLFIKCSLLSGTELTSDPFRRPNMLTSVFKLLTAALLMEESLSPSAIANPPMTSLVGAFLPNLSRALHALNRTLLSISPSKKTNRLMTTLVAAFSPNLPRASHARFRTQISLSHSETTNPLMTSLVAAFLPNLTRTSHALNRTLSSLSSSKMNESIDDLSHCCLFTLATKDFTRIPLNILVTIS